MGADLTFDFGTDRHTHTLAVRCLRLHESLASKNMFSGSIFDAESEYHIHFSHKQKYNDENCLI